MRNDPCRLEDLPNELILQLFKYFSTREIFGSFFYLNFRFDSLIRSLRFLSYSTDVKNDDLDHRCFPFIRTLIIKTIFPYSFQSFPNLHRLILDYLTEDFISQINHFNLPHLDYLSITHRVHPFYIDDLHAKIFSNTFPNLTHASISRIRLPAITSQTFSIRSLYLNEINHSIYLAILQACPNLYSLRVKLSIESKISSNNVVHRNLKRLMINMNADHWPWNDQYLPNYLQCLPNLEQFHLTRSISNRYSTTSIIPALQEYQWLSSILQSSHWMLFNRFQFDLHLNRVLSDDLKKISSDWKRRFVDLHGNFYSNFLIIFSF